MSDRARLIKDLLWLAVCASLPAMAFRLWFGLGATTNLSDAVPWGLWKILNMVAGVALATGGFTVGFLVYVLGLERYRPLVKPAILVAVLGYGSAVFALALDIGLPHRIWHPVLMWNVRSFLFEVAWCVMLYFTVTLIEISPTVLQRLRLERAASHLHRIAPGVVIIGIALSSLHHSSLGSLFLVTPQRLHPLWFTPRLPLLFIVSAMGAGMMVVVLARLVYARLYDPDTLFGKAAPGAPVHICATDGRPVPEADPSVLRMLQGLASIAAAVLALFVALKAIDLVATGAVAALLAFSWESYLYVAEIVLLGIVPIALVAHPSTRRQPYALAAASLSAAVGLVLNRLNVGVFGYFRDAGQVYVPSVTEWAIGLGVFAAAGLVFLFSAEHLPVFDEAWQGRERQLSRFMPAFDRFSGVWNTALASGMRRTTLIAVLVIPLAWTVMYPRFGRTDAGPGDRVSPPIAADVKRASLMIDGDQDREMVTFPHADHQRRLGGERSCATCHHLCLPRDSATPCSRCHRQITGTTTVFDHTAHLSRVARLERISAAIPVNHACGRCHQPGLAKQTASAVACTGCHREDMSPARLPATPHEWMRAGGYRGVLHERCIGCHRAEAQRVGRPALADCGTCHRAGRTDGPRLAEAEPAADQSRQRNSLTP